MSNLNEKADAFAKAMQEQKKAAEDCELARADLETAESYIRVVFERVEKARKELLEAAWTS